MDDDGIRLMAVDDDGWMMTMMMMTGTWLTLTTSEDGSKGQIASPVPTSGFT